MTRKHTQSENIASPQVEQMPIGPQFVIEGYAPVTLRERLNLMANEPPKPKRPCVQKPCDIGLFDGEAEKENMDRTHVFLPNERNQLDLF